MKDPYDILMYVDEGVSDRELSWSGRFIPEMLQEKLSSGGCGFMFAVPPGYDGRLSGMDRTVKRTGADDITFWKDVFSRTSSSAVVRIAADSPFLDPDIVSDMITLHSESHAEFTFSENLPAGLTCEIVSRELVDGIPAIDQPTLPLGQVVRGNLNGFDAEIYYRDPDIRHLRLSFLCRDPRERMIMEGLQTATGKIPPYGDILRIVEGNPSVLAAGPSYVELELTGRCDQDCIFCYRNQLERPHGDMDISLVKKILGDMKAFGLPYTICLGGSGEPMMNGDFYRVLDMLHSEKNVERIIVETNGTLADANYRSWLEGKKDGRVHTIVNMNGLDRETYKALHGFDGFSAAEKNITALKDSGFPLYLQVMKINETESFLDRYYDSWESRKIPIILQKQNTFLGLIPDRRYSDLTPIERGHCWHLLRDMYILSDGTVGFCRQDVKGLCPRGSAADSTLESIWSGQREDFLRNYRGEYPGKPACAECDEWYTFNC